MFLLGKWLEDAKSWGLTEESKEYYEWNARTIISIWQPWKEGALRDYAGKTWNGMFSGYYQPRWELFIEHLKRSLINNTSFDSKEYDMAVRERDFNWTHSHELYSSEITGNAIEIARRINQEYRHYFENEKAKNNEKN
jgi:alpha-N-acetylglucosaminidase